MMKKDDWRLLNDVEYLKDKYINSTDGEELTKRIPYLKECVFCLERVQDNQHQWWFITEEMDCCICEECYRDFKEMFRWKELDVYDVDWSLRCPKCGTELKTVCNEDYVYACGNCDVLYDESFDELQLND